ncbi:hypothetical protein [Bradyrhizobium sp. Cp5.3]|uniref:hypothetical protein n=1 Tax=Bradyrhizobium sp. Cp5.3 TaxID=443598 RepID=UPI0012EBE94A|nr:hypothetical protein [Bradyrhizobium sp. Cp5.3]
MKTNKSWQTFKSEPTLNGYAQFFIAEDLVLALDHAQPLVEGDKAMLNIHPLYATCSLNGWHAYCFFDA